MLLDILFSGGNIFASLLSFVLMVPALLFSLSAHEYGHGYAAYTQGDHYAKSIGRLSLNPLKHLDPLGTLCLFIVGFGWAKPVPVFPAAFKNGKKSMLIVAFAGIFVNLMLAIIAIFLGDFLVYCVFSRVAFFATEAGSLIAWVLQYVLMELAFINIALAIFNLLPIPPLDGYKIFRELFSGVGSGSFFSFMERYATIILIVFLVFSNRIGLLSALDSAVYNAFERLIGLLFIAFK